MSKVNTYSVKIKHYPFYDGSGKCKKSATRQLVKHPRKSCHIRDSVVSAVDKLGTQQWLQPGHSWWVEFHVAESMNNPHSCHHGHFDHELIGQWHERLGKKIKNIYFSYLIMVFQNILGFQGQISKSLYCVGIAYGYSKLILNNIFLKNKFILLFHKKV